MVRVVLFQYVDDDSCSVNLILWLLNLAQGSRTDLLHKRRRNCPRNNLNSLITFPPWIRIFRANTSTSRRTQAAALAYMFPSCYRVSTTTAMVCRSSSASRCRIKLDARMHCIVVPSQFAVMVEIYASEIKNGNAVVCNEGINYSVPQLPPRNKVIIDVYV